MEASEEHEGGLLNQILPLRLEDAGIEDCTLPPESIREVFLKAATAVKSRVASFLTSHDDDDIDRHCVEDPWPTTADEQTDVVIGILPECEPLASCATEKGARVPEFDHDSVVVGGGEINGEERWAKLVVGGIEEGGVKACVDGWQGLEIGSV